MLRLIGRKSGLSPLCGFSQPLCQQSRSLPLPSNSHCFGFNMTRQSSVTFTTTNTVTTNGRHSIDSVESRGNYQVDLRSQHKVFAERPDRPLYQYQESMPRLPLLTLHESIQKLLPTALPLATNETEAKNFRRACEIFPQQAKELQERLEQRVKEKEKDSSWLQQWWNQSGYLQVRDSVMIHVSYFFRLDPYIASVEQGSPLSAPLQHDVFTRGAQFLQSSARFAQSIRHGTLPTETMGRTSPTPLCSTQYKYLLASCRIPAPMEDFYRLYFNSTDQSTSLPRHAIVARCGYFYSVPVLHEDGSLVSTKTLVRLLKDCQNQAQQQPAESEVAKLGFLTSTDRDSWSEAHELLMKIPSMARALSILQSGICLLAIDDTITNNPTSTDTRTLTSESALRLWHGNKTHTGNRWWDKSIQWILSRDYCGLVGEHALVDGMPSLNLCRDVFTVNTSKFGEDQKREDEKGLVVAPIFHQVWNDELSDKEKGAIAELVRSAELQAIQQIDRNELQVLEYRGYGTRRLRQSVGRPSADAWAQMAMQWAATVVMGVPVATYESTQTRRFLHGRTETTRSISPESAAWVEAMIHGNSDLTHQRELLQKAVESHVQYTREASMARGIDRHFFGLAMCAATTKDETVPDLFKDPLFLRSKRWRLSTSTLPGTCPGFGPVQEDGLGIGYDLSHDDVWYFTITGRRENNFVVPMREQLERCLDEMAACLVDASSPHSRL